jgi:molybdenum cofactor biosynthesis enzyme MoaA
MERNRIPYLTVAVTNRCNYRCNYCSPDGSGGFGEGYGTTSQQIDVPDMKEKIRIAEQEGVTKVRLTGGEPLMAKGIKDVLYFLEQETSLDYALATNGSLAHRFFDDFRKLPRMDLRISLDTLDRERYTRMCNCKDDHYDTVLNNVRILAKEGILKRVAAVVTNDNVQDIGNLLDFCEAEGINLKLFDMYSTPHTKDQWFKIYSPLDQARKTVADRAVQVRQIEYTKDFGIPSLEFATAKGTLVRIKDSNSGTRYSEALCRDCSSLPCQEGLYTILYSADKKLLPCRLSPNAYDARTPDLFRVNLRGLIDIFKQSYHENKFWRQEQ